MMKRLHYFAATTLAALVLTGTALAQTPRYSYSADGSEVTDSKTGLVWRRCAEGMSWGSGTCTGTATTYTHEQALTRAQSQSGWRLPNIKELSSIVDRSRSNPAIDTTAFPATPSNGFWSSSPMAGGSDYARGVYFYDGGVGNYVRSNVRPVRLVR